MRRMIIVALLCALSYAQTATQHRDSHQAHLVSFSSQCTEELGMIGEFKSAVECGAAVVEEPEVCESGLFMFSSKFNFWGCRCCSRSHDHFETHDFWSVYSIRLPNRTQEVRAEDYFGQVQQIDTFTGEKSWINVLPPKKHAWKSELISPPQDQPSNLVEIASIFVSISSFNDARCGKTLVNLFHRALFPSRIQVGIVGYGVHCVNEMCKEMGFEKCEPLKKQIREVVAPVSSRTGFDAAQRFTKSFLRDEEFCMQAQSADDFVKGWDYKTIQEWQKTGNDFAVLTTHAGPLEDLENAPATVPVLCKPSMRDGLPTYDEVSSAKDLSEPLLSPHFSGSFAFSRCDAWREVPHDPHMPSIDTHTETDHIQEVLYGLRLWTTGYDFYTPSQIFSGHDSSAREDATYVYERKVEERKKGINRAQMLLQDGHNANLGDYSLGYERTLDQYAEFAGFDFTRNEVVENYVACIERERVSLGSGFFQYNPHREKILAKGGMAMFAILPTIGVCAGAGTMMLYSQDSEQQTRLAKEQ